MSKTEIQSNKTLELRDEVCPFTLAKSQQGLQELENGQVLEVHLGNSESAANVPRSLDLEGHNVISVDKLGRGHWKVLIEKAE